MDESVMPFCLIYAAVNRFLKIYGLDNNDMDNYRSISNLPFISILIGKVVTVITLLVVGRSTETALLKVHSDISEVLEG